MSDDNPPRPADARFTAHSLPSLPHILSSHTPAATRIIPAIDATLISLLAARTLATGGISDLTVAYDAQKMECIRLRVERAALQSTLSEERAARKAEQDALRAERAEFAAMETRLLREKAAISHERDALAEKVITLQSKMAETKAHLVRVKAEPSESQVPGSVQAKIEPDDILLNAQDAARTTRSTAAHLKRSLRNESSNVEGHDRPTKMRRISATTARLPPGARMVEVVVTRTPRGRIPQTLIPSPVEVSLCSSSSEAPTSVLTSPQRLRPLTKATARDAINNGSPRATNSGE
ncbi:hypothetical protein C8R43DRAFT_1238853 [Mycena crocata]|nr:hypothetical protein C8R43DRAFT_1238853 [Mycena crocata]